MKAQRVKLWLPADIVDWLQAYPGDENEAAERILRREMETERGIMARSSERPAMTD